MVERKKAVQKAVAPVANTSDNPWDMDPADPPHQPTPTGDSPHRPTPAPATNAPLAVPEPDPWAEPERATPAQVELRRSSDRVSGGLVRVTGIIAPVARVEEAVAAWKLFEELKERLLSKDDLYTMKDPRRGMRLVPTRTGWRKYAAFFGVSSDVVDEKRWQRGEDWGYDFLVRAFAPNGQAMVGCGTCAASELRAARQTPTEHGLRARAFTRALNRAIADLIGGGELSAEELPAEQTPDL